MPELEELKKLCKLELFTFFDVASITIHSFADVYLRTFFPFLDWLYQTTMVAVHFIQLTAGTLDHLMWTSQPPPPPHNPAHDIWLEANFLKKLKSACAHKFPALFGFQGLDPNKNQRALLLVPIVAACGWTWCSHIFPQLNNLFCSNCTVGACELYIVFLKSRHFNIKYRNKNMLMR